MPQKIEKNEFVGVGKNSLEWILKEKYSKSKRKKEEKKLTSKIIVAILIIITMLTVLIVTTITIIVVIKFSLKIVLAVSFK